MKDIPMLFSRKEFCCGCGACIAACAAGAIEMKTDEEGFDYPEINDTICARCGKCINIYPIKQKLRD